MLLLTSTGVSNEDLTESSSAQLFSTRTHTDEEPQREIRAPYIARYAESISKLVECRTVSSHTYTTRRRFTVSISIREARKR